MELSFPIEFLVNGTPVSLQAKRPESRAEWKTLVKESSRNVLPEGHFATELPLSMTIFYFPDGSMQGDVDNIVKPILDALCKHIYLDDSQIVRVVVQKFEPLMMYDFRNPTDVLRKAILSEKPVLYIRISNQIFEDLA